MSSGEATGQAIKLLARREHSSRELERKLAAKGFDAEAIAAALTELRDRRLLSDTRFAQEYLRSRRARGYGPVRIALELRERGVERTTIDTVTQETDADWVTRCADARRKKFGAAPTVEAKERARQQRYLNYRGFTAAQIAAAMAEALPE